MEPLLRVIDYLNNPIAEDFAKLKLYSFAGEGSGAGLLMFDARDEVPGNEYPVRMYDYQYGGDTDGLSEVIFSSFTKLIECTTHFLKETRTRNDFEVIPEFFQIDPDGAGKDGVDYWMAWSAMMKEDHERDLEDN